VESVYTYGRRLTASKTRLLLFKRIRCKVYFMEKSTLGSPQTEDLDVLGSEDREPEHDLSTSISPSKEDYEDYELLPSLDDVPQSDADSLPRNPDDTPFMSEDSEFKATPEEHAAQLRKGKKGPSPKPASTYINTSTCPLPRPTYRMYKSDATAPNQRSKQFFNWWNNCPTWAKDRMVAYVYREHPVLLWDAEAEGKVPYTSKNRKFKYIDKIIGSQAFQDDMDFLHKYGCGSYNIKLNEDIRDANRPSKTLSECYVLNVGGGDYKSNPPTDNRISDVEQVDLNHPQNTAYVAFLRGSGKLPEQLSTKEKEAEMAQAEVIKDTLADNRRLTDKVIAMAQDRGNKEQTPDAVSKAIDGAMGIMHEAVKTGNEVTQRAVDFAQQTQSKMMDDMRSRESSGNVDPMDQLNRVLDLVGKLQGGGGSNAHSDEVVELRRQVSQMQADRIAALEARLNQAPTTNPAATPFGSVKEGLQAMKEMKSVIDDISGNAATGGAKEAVEESAADLAPKWLRPFIPVLVPAIGALAEGFFRSRMPAAAPLQMQPTQAAPVYQPPTQAAPIPSNVTVMPTPNGGLPAASPAATPLTTETYGLPPQVAQLLGDIRVPLLNHLNHGMSGARFSDWFIGGFGEPVYKQVIQFGTDGLVTAMYAFAPIGQNLAAFQRENVRAFVDDFIDPDYEAMEKEIAEENRRAEEADKGLSESVSPEPEGGAA
jgi:hypothetical protein